MKKSDDRYSMWLGVAAALLAPFRAPGFEIKRDHTTKFDALPGARYGDLRQNVHNGDLLFCGGRFAFSKAIRFLSGRSKVSHVGIVYWWNDRLMLLESVETDGVRIVPLSQYLNNYENSGKPYNGRLYLARDRRLHPQPIDPSRAASATRNHLVEKVLADAATKLNKQFSMKDVLIFFLQGNTGRFQHVENDQFLCSEFVAACFASVNIQYPGDGRGFIAPEHIAASEHVDVLVEITSI